MEWESTLTSLKKPNVAIKELESKLGHAEFEDSTSPASIVIFSSFYNVVSSVSSVKYPAAVKFITSFLEMETAKKGIELASVHASEQKMDASTVAGASKSASKSTAPGGQKLRSGIFANKLDGKKMYILRRRELIIVCRFQDNETFLLLLLYPTSTTSPISATSSAPFSVQMSSLATVKSATSMHSTSVVPTNTAQQSKQKPSKTVSVLKKSAINTIKSIRISTNGSTLVSITSVVQRLPNKQKSLKAFS